MKIAFILILLIYTLKIGYFAPLIAETRIVNGKTVSISNYPYQLSILFDGLHHCGGALINKTTGITAAHCLLNPRRNYSVRAGSSTLNKGGKIARVRKIILHPKFNKHGVDYDIGLVILGRPLPYGPNVSAVKLPTPKKGLPVGTKAIVTGWGITAPGDELSMSRRLRGTKLPVLSQDLCKRCYGSYVISSRMFCAGYLDGGKDACQGDSGGPLVANGELVGIVSWGIDCAQPYYPGVYARVAKFRSFIKKHTGL